MSQTPRWQRKLARKLTRLFAAHPPRNPESRGDYAAYCDHITRCRPLRPHPEHPTQLETDDDHS